MVSIDDWRRNPHPGIVGQLGIDGRFYPDDLSPSWRVFPPREGRTRNGGAIYTVTALRADDHTTWWGRSTLPWISITLRPRRTKGNPLGLRQPCR